MLYVTYVLNLCFLQEDIKSLCNHIVEEHIKDLDNVDYVNTFKTLKLQYEQFQDKLKTKPGLER